jgi:hypothetical protein
VVLGDTSFPPGPVHETIAAKLHERLSDTSPEVRCVATGVLGSKASNLPDEGFRKVIEALRVRLQEDASEEVRANAVLWLNIELWVSHDARAGVAKILDETLPVLDRRLTQEKSPEVLKRLKSAGEQLRLARSNLR